MKHQTDCWDYWCCLALKVAQNLQNYFSKLIIFFPQNVRKYLKVQSNFIEVPFIILDMKDFGEKGLGSCLFEGKNDLVERKIELNMDVCTLSV